MRHAPAPAVTGTRWIDASPVPEVDPVAGWELLQIFPQANRDRSREYIARGPHFDIHIPVSRFCCAFTPTQARFDWLVRNGFHAKPAAHVTGPWDNHDIDAAIAAERHAVAV